MQNNLLLVSLWKNIKLGEGKGKSKQEAEEKAAEQALEKIGK